MNKNEAILTKAVMDIEQAIYDKGLLESAVSANDFIYLIVGLTIATIDDSDRSLIEKIEAFCEHHQLNDDFKKPVMDALKKEAISDIVQDLYDAYSSATKDAFNSDDILDIGAIIINVIHNYTHISNDGLNDVVLTPTYTADLMASIAGVNDHSKVIDMCAGTGSLLLACKRSSNVCNIEGVEFLPIVHTLGILSHIVNGYPIDNFHHGDSLVYVDENGLDADVLILNPPYSTESKGFGFALKAMDAMGSGKAVVLTMQSAGNGQALPTTSEILERHTLKASINMPKNLFGGKASVQTNIFVFDIGKPHDFSKDVVFVDMEEDGYKRSNRKKMKPENRIQDVNDASGRYAEVVAKVNGEPSETNYYTEEDNTFISEPIGTACDDWVITKHKKFDTVPTEEDFKRVIRNYYAFKYKEAFGALFQ